MRCCLHCRRVWRESVQFCPSDGQALVAISDHVDPMVGFELDGRFALRSLLGAGGMGFVYLAEQLGLGRKVAVKMLYGERSRDPATRERFRREAHALANLDHPHIVRVHAYGEAYGTIPYLVMEFLQGQPLDMVIHAAGRLSPHLAMSVLSQMADALAAAHGAGVVHRDLKPENVQLDHTPGKLRARLLDFGLVLLSDEDGERRLTRAGTVFGTPEYMAPEQIRSQEVEARTDLYALGVMLFEMLEGVPPFRGFETTDTFELHLNENPPPLSASCEALGAQREQVQRLVNHLLEKRPKDRPKSAAAVADRVKELLEQIPPPEAGTIQLGTALERAQALSEPGQETLDPESEAPPSDGFDGVMEDEEATEVLRSALGSVRRRRRTAVLVAAAVLVPAAVVLGFQAPGILARFNQGTILRDETGRPLAFQRLPPFEKQRINAEGPEDGRLPASLRELVRGGRTEGTAERPGGPAQTAYEAARRGVDRELASRGLRLNDVASHPAASRYWKAQDAAARDLKFDLATEQLVAFQEIARQLTVQEIASARIRALRIAARSPRDRSRLRALNNAAETQEPFDSAEATRAFFLALDEL